MEHPQVVVSVDSFCWRSCFNHFNHLFMRVELVKQCHKPSPVITIFIGGMFTIPSHGWFIIVLPCFTMFYPCDISMLVCYVIHGPGTVSSQRGP